MLRTRCKLTSFRAVTRGQAANFSSSQSHASSHQPNAPLDLDPAFKSLLKDVEISMSQKTRVNQPVEPLPPLRQLEEVPGEDIVDVETPAWMEEDLESRDTRKSPAAVFGSRHIGAVVIPKELETSVKRLIEGVSTVRRDTDASNIIP